jgi:hypothetical protein
VAWTELQCANEIQDGVGCNLEKGKNVAGLRESMHIKGFGFLKNFPLFQQGFCIQKH